MTLAIDPGDYTAAAALVELDADGALVGVISTPSEPVRFLQAAVAPVPSVVPAATTTTQLAATGFDPARYGVAAALAALAGGLLLMGRRRLRRG